MKTRQSKLITEVQLLAHTSQSSYEKLDRDFKRTLLFLILTLKGLALTVLWYAFPVLKLM